MSFDEEHQFLGGKVRRISLPVIEGKPQGESPPLKRMLLPQGELAQFHSCPEGMRYLAYAELRAGAVRGNHYHKFKQEWLYIISGKLSLVLEDIELGLRETLTLSRGDLAFIPTGVAHALHVQESGHAIEFSPVAFDPTDSFPYNLDSSRVSGQ